MDFLDNNFGKIVVVVALAIMFVIAASIVKTDYLASKRIERCIQVAKEQRIGKSGYSLESIKAECGAE